MTLLERAPLHAIFLLTCLVAACSAKTAGAQEAGPPIKPQKVLILGNSITKHGPKADIGWTGNWGMAASAEDKDFVHLVMAALTKGGAKPEFMVRNVADFERGYASYDANEKLKEPIAFAPDLIILAIGENVPGLSTDEAKTQFKTSLMKVLKALKGPGNPTFIIRSSFWANAAKDQILREASQEMGGRYVDISALGKDESNYARSERPFKHEGVARHPGDKGMQAIAAAILGVIEKQR